MRRKSRLPVDIGSSVQRERLQKVTTALGSPPVVVQSGGMMVSVRLADKMPLTRENLIGMMKILRAKADEVSAGVGDNWFPCGFADLHVRGDCPLVKMFKEWGTVTRGDVWEVAGIGRMYKAYGGGFDIRLEIPERNASEAQSLNYKTPMYQLAQQILARMGVRADVRTMVD
jgi:hypothetical protein